ncbi:hypothetical protein PH552_33095 [Rhizobium sp. CNPSo 3968]|uniref:lysozyme inhibitor LprI family protein n=1 Tax=Rhizobium sp. CNPSo 3968 TaxID=3021408 RepID=UPI000DE0F0A1|nr:lysozyme inhibitor LprI family protein [Rhizobium sp. CNPSo 3968]MDK4724189.1 hypothetical protein [Rhizobium sp. CNPSo 3968]
MNIATAFMTGVGRIIQVGLGFCALLVAGLLSTSTPAVSTGFDCKFAKSNVEKLICADAGLSRLDGQMNALFDNIRKETAGRDGETGKIIDPVDREQTLWRKTVRDKCRDVTCLTTAYAARLSDMQKNWAEALEPSDQ